MVDFIAIGIAFGVGVLAFIIQNPRYLYKSTNRNYTPFMQKRFALHPDGQVSSIEYDYPNENKKRLWKFHEWEQEIPAEVPEDIIVQPGAEYGNAFYVFRYCRNGAEVEWADPAYREYFSKMAALRCGFEGQKKGRLQQVDLERMSRQGYKKMVSDGFDEDYVESQYSLDKKMMEFLLKKKGKGFGGLPLAGGEEGG